MPEPTPVDEPRLTAKGQATRSRIVEAAAVLVYAQGAAGTSIDDVRRKAGVSGSQMQHYFVDKQALMRAVVRHEADQVLESQEPQLSHLDSFEALRAWADAAIGQQLAQGCIGGCSFGSLAGELAACDEGTRADLSNGFSRWEAKLRDGLVAMHERGFLRPDADPATLALGLLAALQGGLLLTETTRSIRPLEAAMNSMLAYIGSFAAEPASAH